MSGLFGENPTQGQVSPENPLGLNRAPEEVANPGQPDQAMGATGTGNIGQSQQGNVNNFEENATNSGQNITNQGQNVTEQAQNQTGQEEVQHDLTNINANDSYEKKVAFVKQKFSNVDEFKEGIEELQRKLGRNEHKTFDSTEEGINYYIELENELGRTSNVDQTRQENQRLKQELNGLRNTVNQMLLQNQMVNRPVRRRDPVTGRFVSPNQSQQINNQVQNQASNNQVNEIDISFDDIDTDQFMKEFYEKGPNADSFKKVLKNASEKITEQKLNQILQQRQQEEQRKQQEKQQQQQHKQIQGQLLKSNYDQQVETVKQKYGEQEFAKHKQNMLNIFKKYPMYLNPQLFPNGFETVFNEAKNMASGYQEQQTVMQNQQQYNAAQKMAARMPRSKPGQRFSSRQISQEEVEKRQIFQPQKTSGIFG